MSRYADRNEKPLHKDDAVRVVDVGGELESAEGTIHSFYLLRDGKHRARVHLAGGRAVGVRIDKLVKIHADDGPMPVHDGFLGLHAAALSAALALRRGTPKGSGAGAFGDAVEALCAALLQAYDALDAACRTWPPPIEPVEEGHLTAAARAVKRASERLEASPPRADALALAGGGAAVAERAAADRPAADRSADAAAASLLGGMRQLSAALIESSRLAIGAFGWRLPRP